MTDALTLTAYSGAILAGSLAGGALPLFQRRERSDSVLSFSAGVMLGAAFFHMLPEAVLLGGHDVVPWVVAGFLFLFLLERFLLVHVCAEPGPSDRLVAHPPPPPQGLREHAGHDHAHEATGCDVHTLGVAAFVGLSLHTLVDGFALGAAHTEPSLGLLVFAAILAHKIPSSVALTASCSRTNRSSPR
jgi:zinc and cadmium transporter